MRAAQEGLREGVKGIPGAIRSKTVMEPSPVKSYALNPFSSPNMSAQKWKKNINNRFRREAAGEIKKRLFSNNSPAPQPKPILAKTATITPYIPRPSPYLLKTPINYKAIYTPYNTTPKEPELRGGARKTRRSGSLRKNLTRRFVKAKILRY